MPNHIDFVRKHANGSIVRIAAMGIGAAVAITDTELLVGHAGIVGRLQARITKRPLTDLTDVSVAAGVRTVELRLAFASADPLTVMFSATDRGKVDRIAIDLRAAIDRMR